MARNSIHSLWAVGKAYVCREIPTATTQVKVHRLQEPVQTAASCMKYDRAVATA